MKKKRKKKLSYKPKVKPFRWITLDCQGISGKVGKISFNRGEAREHIEKL
jgi:hypothetical protein